MASIESVRASIDANVKTNGQQKITGSVLNSVLNGMVDLSEQTGWDIDVLRGNLDEQGEQLVTLASDLKEKGNQIASLSGEVSNQGGQIASLSQEVTEKFSEHDEKIAEVEQSKADQDGKYPELTAGFANNLVGRGEAVDATINFRPSGGTSIEDGAARVKELKGNSVVWNQGFHAANFPNTATSFWRGQHADISIVDGVCRMVATEEGSRAIYQNFQTPFGGTGHKVMVVCDFKRYSSASERFYVYLVLEDGAAEKPSQYFSDTNRRREVAFLTLTSGIKDAGIYPHLNGAVGDVVDLYSLTIYDLTQMFGAGNEPTSVEEFYNRIPQNVDLYAYNEGEIISTNAEGIKSVGFNAWDGVMYKGFVDDGSGNIGGEGKNTGFIRVLPNTDYYIKTGSQVWQWGAWYDEQKNYISGFIGYNKVHKSPSNATFMCCTCMDAANIGTTDDFCINLAHSGYRNGEYQPYVQFIRDIDSRIREAFPNGLRSAGNASDKVYNKNGKGYIEKHIGVLDLGTIDWVHQAIEGVYVFRSNGQSKSYGIKDSLNGLCSRYLHTSQTANIINSDGYIDVYSAWLFDEGNIIINDSRYSSPKEFKNSLNGVYLFYELAEPEILEFDEPFNLDYEVWDFGTEQMIATEPSAPIKASIVYGFNAVDSVRTAQLEIAELKTQIAQMQTIVASMTAQSAMIKE